MMTKGDRARVIYTVGYAAGVVSLGVSVAIDSAINSALLGAAVIVVFSLLTTFVGGAIVSRVAG
jgi:hypothetical protein